VIPRRASVKTPTVEAPVKAFSQPRIGFTAARRGSQAPVSSFGWRQSVRYSLLPERTCGRLAPEGVT